jgi:hypothetical protein
MFCLSRKKRILYVLPYSQKKKVIFRIEETSQSPEAGELLAKTLSVSISVDLRKIFLSRQH